MLAPLQALCADPSLTDVQLLEHLPVYLARSHRLLVLAGPTLPSRLHCALECYAWRAIGGRPQDVDISLTASTPDERADVVSSIDAFHVMWTRGGSNSEVLERIVRTIELASIDLFNNGLRDLLPRVVAQVERVDERPAVNRSSRVREEHAEPHQTRGKSNASVVDDSLRVARPPRLDAGPPEPERA